MHDALRKGNKACNTVTELDGVFEVFAVKKFNYWKMASNLAYRWLLFCCNLGWTVPSVCRVASIAVQQSMANHKQHSRVLFSPRV